MAQDEVGNLPMKQNQNVYANLQKRFERLVENFIENTDIRAFLHICVSGNVKSTTSYGKIIYVE